MARTDCKHCGSALPEAMSAFCCSGCETAFEIINGGGWQQYYQVREQEAARPVDEDAAALSFEYLNTEDYRGRHARQDGERLETSWYLDGLRCGACTWLVEQVARGHEGVSEAVLNFGEARLTLRCQADTDLTALAALLARLGYVAGLLPHMSASNSRSLMKLGLSGALAANLMLMSVPYYVGLEDGFAGYVFGVISLCLSIPLLLYGARDYYQRALWAVKNRIPGLDLPIAIGLSGAFVLSTYNLVRGNFHGLYYDSMGMLVFFLLLGKGAREAGINKALAAGRRLLARMPQLVEVKREDKWIQLPAAQLVPGDLLRLRTGDVLPLDAVLDSDEATLNLHVVSGESKPVVLPIGSELLAGSINMGGEMVARATSSFSDSRFARLEEMARGLKDSHQTLFTNRFAWFFLSFALGSALLGAWIWWPHSGEQAFSVALTVLIVVCPCALALADPVAEAFALRHASAMGAWVKDGDLFKHLPRIRQVIFDKTGILTTGVPSIAKREHYGSAPHWLEAAIAALEAQVKHPLVHAFLQTPGPKPAIERVEEVSVVPGAGISGKVDGKHIIVAAPSRFQAFGVPASVCEDMLTRAHSFPSDYTLVGVLMDGEPAALFGLLDEIRPEAKTLISRLRASGLKLVMLSGDHPRAAARVAEQVGIKNYHGNMLPEQKLAYIQAHDGDTTLMAGDGFNDMGALARAAVGVTHAHGSEAALRFSGVIFRDRNMGRLAGLFQLATTSRLAIRLGMGLSLLYNFLAVVLALRGIIGPLGAALLMPLSSLSLIGTIAVAFHLRSKRWAFSFS